MKAVVLVGGEGTRLRPLTETVPKPLLPLMDRPSLAHVLDHLAAHGVHEVVLSSPYLEETFDPFISSRRGDPAITWITEREPLGTGGAVINALDALDTDEPFFALNGDILTDLDLTAMFAFHHSNNAGATIALQHVDDARPFGLVEMDPHWRILEFREKPTDLVPGDVNAGTYLLDPSTLQQWRDGGNISIERQIFPGLIDAGVPMFGYSGDCYWMDLGTPEKYLQAHFDMMSGKVHGVEYGEPWIDPSASVDIGSSLGRWVVVGPGAAVAAGASIEDSVLHAGSSVGRDSAITDSVLGAGSTVGDGCRLDGCVLGEGSTVPDGTELHGSRLGAGITAR